MLDAALIFLICIALICVFGILWIGIVVKEILSMLKREDSIILPIRENVSNRPTHNWLREGF
jgi:hypothetical protein